MRSLVWRVEASADVAKIVAYVAERNPSAARRLKTIIDEAVLPLMDHPYLLRPGRVPGTRELVAHPNYIVVYRVTDDTVEIINVVHARQKYP